MTDFSITSPASESSASTALGFTPEDMPVLCLNLCDIVCTTPFDEDGIAYLCDGALARSGLSPVTRLYAGSYFCDQRFLALDDEAFASIDCFCRANNMRVTLVLPIFAQSTLAFGINRMYEILERHAETIDEVVVNDFGMAARLASWLETDNPREGQRRISLCAGRLMAKEQRDPRYAQTANNSARPCSLDARGARYLVETFGINMIELDPFAPLVDVSPLEGSIPFALHLPHCFMSTGHVCEAASAGCAPEDSFRANARCAQQCLASFSVSYDDGNTTGRPSYLVKSGRTLLFENPGCCICGGAPARIVWNPDTFAFFTDTVGDFSPYSVDEGLCR